MREETNKSETASKSLSSFSLTQVIPGGDAGLGPSSAFTALKPRNVSDQIQAPNSTVFSLEAYAGIIPPAHELAKYGSEERAWILNEAKLNSEHAREIDKKSPKITANDEVLHRVIPALVVICFLISSTIIAVFANAALGSAGIGLTLATLAGAYFKGQHRSNIHKNRKLHSHTPNQDTQSTE